MTKAHTILIICGWCWLLAGCNAGGAPVGASSATATPQGPAATPTPFTVDATSRWPNLSVKRISTALSDRTQIIFQGTGTPDGRYLLTKIQTRYATPSGSYSPEQIALYDTTTGALQVIGSAHDGQHGLTGYVADDHWVAWYERGLPEVSSDPTWSLYLYNRDTGATQTIVQNAQGQGVYPYLALNQGHFAWDEVDGDVTLDRANFVLKLLDLSTGTMTVVARRAVGPVMSWPWVGWGQVTTSDGSGVVMFENMLTQQRVTLNDMPYEMILLGTQLVYDSDNISFVYVPDIGNITANAQRYVPSGISATSGTVNSLTFNGRYVGWHSLGGDTSAYLYDVQTKQSIQFPMKYPFNGTQTTQIIGHTVTWMEDPNTPDQTTAYQQKHQDPPLIYGLADLPNGGK